MNDAVVDRQERSLGPSHVLVGLVGVIFLLAWVAVFWWWLRYPFVTILGVFLLLIGLGLTGWLRREIATGAIGILLLFAFLGVLLWWIKSVPLTIIIVFGVLVMLYDVVQTIRHGEEGAPR